MKHCILYAGVNGAGKTTIYEMEDETIKQMNRQEKAGKEARKRIMQFIKEGKDYCQETALCGRDILDEIVVAKDEGYYVEVRYLFVETIELAIKRVHKRIELGGHSVQDELIRERYYESINNLKKLIEEHLVDEVLFINNTDYMQKFAQYKDGKMKIFDNEIPDIMKWCLEI